MIVSFDKMSPMARSMMTSRGAPDRALHGAFDLKVRGLVAPCVHESRKPIPPSVQISHYARSLADPSGSWLMVVGSRHDEDLAVAAALGLMKAATIKSVQNASRYPRPYFWRVFGGSYDKLRNGDRFSEDFRETLGRMGLLVLSNLAANSSPEKIEKCRDIVSRFRGGPCVVTVVGCDPLSFALDHLFMKPDRVLHLGRSARNRQI